MKSSYLLTTALAAALLSASCGNDTSVGHEPEINGDKVVTFTLRTPVGETVAYGRALHDGPECTINSLVLYEYEVNDEDGTTSLTKVMKYPDGKGKDVIALTDGGNGSYTFSITVPAENEGRKYAYRFVANDPVAEPALGTSFDEFSSTQADVKLALAEGAAAVGADILADSEKGIAMSGKALYNGSDVITMAGGIKCEVAMTRIVSRVDIRYQTPNLRLTKVELHGAPAYGYLFPQEAIPGHEAATCLDMTLNSIHMPLTTDYLKDLDGKDTVELKKAFYLYERTNSEENTALVHIEYEVSVNDREEPYTGSIDVPFRKTSGDKAYIDTERNHLYTIVLGNGTDPVSGKVTAQLIIDEWNLIEIDEPIANY